MSTYSPQEAAAIAQVPVSAVQKAITAGHLASVGPARGRRLIDERSVLSFVLARTKPRGITLTLREARSRLEEADLDAPLHVAGGSVLDLPRMLAEPRRRLRLLERGRELVTGASRGRQAQVKGTDINVADVLAHVAAGTTDAAIADAYPALRAEDVRALTIWAQANPSRGRPPTREIASIPTNALPTGWSKTMRIAASQIDAWSARREAQGELPLLIRRLIHASSSPTAITMPGGDSINTPGWDGMVETATTSAWVPGRTVWELSCEAGPAGKATRELNKRTERASEAERADSVFIFVTARRWPGKAKWLKAANTVGAWKAVRAYDADDLEQWLEQSPAVAVWFGDLIGLTGQGVVSPGAYWLGWAGQTAPAITPDALFAGRERQRDKLIESLSKRLSDRDHGVLSLQADSAAEAAAFATAALGTNSDFSVSSLVVNAPEGWRFVEQNPLVKVAIAASPELVDNPPRRPGLVIIVPYAAGDMADQYRGAAAREDGAEIDLDRPNFEALENALDSIGVEQAEARRLAQSSGRSWSVIRRRLSTNPAIREPGWLSGNHIQALSTICLLGSWNANREADRRRVEHLAGRSYDDVERDLLWLAKVDDPPVIQIGPVWKAKSPLELLDLFGVRITRGELDRFFAIAGSLLSAPDPVLELPEEQRYTAGIYGKERPESELLFRAICDTLIKLAVRGTSTGLAHLDVGARVTGFVEDLLGRADETRWLSLHDNLPALAEAAPHAFLGAVEASLRELGAPVTALLRETAGAGFMGQCWHAGLLWALELLAWSPAQLPRVVLILAKLAHIEIKGNWGNSPRNTLLDILRSWYPQTSASLPQRIETLDLLIRNEPDIAADLLDRLASTGHDTASPNHRPAWRDDDAGSGGCVTRGERYGMLAAAADRQIILAAGHAVRVAKLIEKVGSFDEPRILKVVDLAAAFCTGDHNDEERECLRAALREHIHRRKNYDEGNADGFRHLGDLEQLYASLEPIDLVVRHLWLFADSWPKLPLRERGEDISGRSERAERERAKALKEIVAAHGLGGVERLAAGAIATGHVGSHLASGDYGDEQITSWFVARAVDLSGGDPMMAIGLGMFRAGMPRSTRLLELALEKARTAHWSNERLTRLLTLAPECRSTWDLAAAAGADVERGYWQTCRPGWLHPDDPELEVALRRLVDAGRPQTAIMACHMQLEKVKPQLLYDLLRKLVEAPEPNAKVREWDVCAAVIALEASKAIDRLELAKLEFALMPALSIHAPKCAASLYESITMDPRLFTELVTLSFLPKDGESVELTDAEKEAAESAYQVLHQCKRVPGIQANGTIDAAAFGRFMAGVRALCEEAGLLEGCDVMLGEILAHAPGDESGIWPCIPVRDLLDRPEHEVLRRGFRTGVFNKRGGFSKSLTEGGLQERALAEHFRAQAQKLERTHVYLAATLAQIALRYDHDATREDQQARLRMESH